MEEIFNFINGLNPEDIGFQDFDEHRLYFEGFTDECWQDIHDTNMEAKELEDQLLKEMAASSTVIDYGWTGEYFDPCVFYTIVKK
jgi:hypothetical protein